MTTTENICAPVHTLSESIDRFLITKGIEKKKYFSKYLVVGEKIWEQIFQNTIWVQKSVWKELKDDSPYPSIDKPADCVRLFSIAVLDECQNLQPLYYNSQLNIIPKPSTRKCSCTACDCSVCEDIENMTVTTKELFTISGITYYEKTWLKYCKNGDIMEYKEVPTKKFNDFIGDGGDYNEDYNNDYSIGGNALANFSIVTVPFQRKVCTLETKPCGCPVENKENECIIQEFCGCWLPYFCNRRKKHCDQFSQNINNNYYGEVKLSECGTKIFYKPAKEWRAATKTKYPDFLQVIYQTNGKNPNQEAQVPDYAEMCLWKGTDWLSKAFNNSYSPAEKQLAKYEYVEEQGRVIKFLNPFKLSDLSKIQDLPQKW